MSENEWRNIDTAPRDGTQVWLWSERQYSRPVWGWYSGALNSWMAHVGDRTDIIKNPTHWMPLPEPPK